VSAGITRRSLLAGAGCGAAALLLPPRLARADAAYTLPTQVVHALRTSPLVYISPLKRDGSESECHGEVWYFWDRGAVVIGTTGDAWKARAVASGLERARIWVGDFGRGQKGPDGPFRKAPSFLAGAARDSDPATFERLYEAFGKRYADEWAKWGPRFRSGYSDGARILIRYTPRPG
jgi:hypothetical protein